MKLHPAEKKLINDIKEYGWHVLNVFDKNGTEPEFAYSIGLYKTFQHPEIIIIGLRQELAHILINNIGEKIRAGGKYQPGLFYSDILDDYECFMLNVSKESYSEYVGYGIWYYDGDQFPLLQCIYPTLEGAYPWEKEWPEEIRTLQPMLGEIN